MSKISLGLGLAHASVDVDLPPWKRIKTFFSRRDISEHVTVLLANSHLAIQRSDEGELRIVLWVVNFSSRQILIDRFTVDRCSLLNISLPDLPWVPQGLPQPLSKRTVGCLASSCQLNAAAIRRIKESSPPEAVRLLTGGLYLQVSGALHVTPAKKPVRFELQDHRPVFAAYWIN